MVCVVEEGLCLKGLEEGEVVAAVGGVKVVADQGDALGPVE